MEGERNFVCAKLSTFLFGGLFGKGFTARSRRQTGTSAAVLRVEISAFVLAAVISQSINPNKPQIIHLFFTGMTAKGKHAYMDLVELTLQLHPCLRVGT